MSHELFELDVRLQEIELPIWRMISGHVVRVLDLATLIELKRGSTRLKDQVVLPVLEKTLRQRGG